MLDLQEQERLFLIVSCQDADFVLLVGSNRAVVFIVGHESRCRWFSDGFKRHPLTFLCTSANANDGCKVASCRVRDLFFMHKFLLIFGNARAVDRLQRVMNGEDGHSV